MNKKPRNGFFAFISKVFIQLFNYFSWLVDKILFNNKGLVIISLVMSIFICVAIDYDTISIRLFNDTTQTVTISDVKVNVLYDETAYKVSDIPSTVDISLTGETKDIQIFRQQGEITVTADLRKLDEGSNIVDFTVDSLPSSLSAKITPANVTAKIYKLITRQFTMSSELLVGNNQKLTDFEQPELVFNTVKITGTSQELSSIRTVKALVDATGQVQDFETNARIVAYDANGTPLNVTIEPETVEAKVKYVVNNTEHEENTNVEQEQKEN